MLLAIIPATSLMAVAMFGKGLPYNFFSFTRFIVAATCLGLAWWIANSEARKNISGLLPFHIALAVLYQPIFRIHLTREIWWWVNLGTIVFFSLTVVCVWMASCRKTR